MEQLGNILAPIWDAGTADGDFTCFVIVLTPVICLKIWCDVSSFFLLYNIALDVKHLSCFYVNFSIIFSSSENIVGMLIGIALNLQIAFGSMDILVLFFPFTNISFLWDCQKALTKIGLYYTKIHHFLGSFKSIILH